jgi:hypothetical protein
MKKYRAVLWILAIALSTASSCKKKDKDNPSGDERNFAILDVNGTEVEDGHEFRFGTNDPTANLVLIAKNKTGETIYLKTMLTGVTGTDGSELEFCFGNCYTGMALNQAYPTGQGLEVPANSQTQPDAIHYWNHYNAPCSYTVEIFEVDASGNRIGDAFTFKYTAQ